MLNSEQMNTGAAATGLAGAALTASSIAKGGEVKANEHMHKAYVERMKQVVGKVKPKDIDKVLEANSHIAKKIDDSAKVLSGASRKNYLGLGLMATGATLYGANRYMQSKTAGEKEDMQPVNTLGGATVGAVGLGIGSRFASQTSKNHATDAKAYRADRLNVNQKSRPGEVKIGPWKIKHSLIPNTAAITAEKADLLSKMKASMSKAKTARSTSKGLGIASAVVGAAGIGAAAYQANKGAQVGNV